MDDICLQEFTRRHILIRAKRKRTEYDYESTLIYDYTSGDFLSERRVGSIPITVYHVTMHAIVTREEDVCLDARLSRLNS